TALAAYAPTPSVLVRGGRERQDSVMQALTALPADIEHVFIHDCARPLIRAEQLVALHKIVRREHAVVLAHRVTDTIKAHHAGRPWLPRVSPPPRPRAPPHQQPAAVCAMNFRIGHGYDIHRIVAGR